MALRSSMLVLLVAMALCGACSGAGAAVYKVGGPDGWIKRYDYNRWSSTKEFHVGDTLLFSYNKLYHNVIEVTEQGFNSCNSSSPIVVYASGSDSVTLERPGHHYFLCGVPGHCAVGQKVGVMVSLPIPESSVSSPSPAPSAIVGSVYKVGGPNGWIISFDYNRWSSTKEFHVGDTLLFSYNKLYHNVIEVTKEGFDSCNSTSPIANYTSGSDRITLERSGHHYFLCGVPGHCAAGQKVDVKVSLPVPDSSVSSPSPAPSGFASPSTPHTEEKPPHSAALTNAPKLALAVFGSVLLASKLMF